MVRCPKCNQKIDYLLEYSEVEVRYRFSLDEHSNPDWAVDEYSDDDFPVTEYKCPRCQQVICYDEEVAVAFLHGEEIIPIEEPVLAAPEREYFPVIQTCREEVAMMFAPEFREEKMAGLDDAAIERIANKVGEHLFEGDLYWEILEGVVNGW